MLVQIATLVVLLLLSAAFSSTETAFTSLSSHKARQLATENGKRGQIVKELSQNPDRLLTTILLGNNLVNIAASAFATSFTIKLFGNKYIGVTTGVLTLLILIFAELTPKRIAIVLNDRICLFMAWPVYLLSIILKPVNFLINYASSLVTRFIIPKDVKSVSFESLLHIMNEAEEEGLVENYENEMVKSVFRLNDLTVQAIMTHRTDVFSLDKNMAIKDAARLISEKGFSRIPVFDKEAENIVGIVLSNDVTIGILKDDRNLRLSDIMHEPIFIPSNRKLHELFYLMKTEKLNIAVILDEYGGLAGIVSREDIIEEILGELYDENEVQGRERIQSIGDNVWNIAGDTSLRQFSDTFEIDLPDTEYAETLAGYIVEQLDRLPAKGDKIKLDNYFLEIDKIEKNRIVSIRFVLCKDSASSLPSS